MRLTVLTCSLGLLNSAALAQTAQRQMSFDVASVKRSQTVAGPDANNRLVFAPAGLTARNATLRRLIAEAYQLQVRQVLGPAWLDQNEYEIEAKPASPVSKQDLSLMLQALLTERFQLQQHRGTRELRVYELVADRAGPKIHSVSDGDAPEVFTGSHFHGTMRRLADVLAVQLSIALPDDPTRPGTAAGSPAPVLDKTGLDGIYDFDVNIRLEPGSDIFALWQRTLRDLGLRLENRKTPVEVLVVDSAEKIPTGN